MVRLRASSLGVGDGDGLTEVTGVCDLIDEKVGQVGAGDLVGGGGWGEDFGGASGGIFGEDRWADDDVLQAAGEDFGFDVGFVLRGAAEEGGHEEVLVPGGGLCAAYAETHHGDDEEFGNAGRVHGGDDVAGGGGFELRGLPRGGAADGVDDDVVRGHGLEDVGWVGGVADEDVDPGLFDFGGVADEDGDLMALCEGAVNDEAAGFAGGSKD